MRAVHFHPHGMPSVLTAEVQDPSPTSELPETLTTKGPFVTRGGNELDMDIEKVNSRNVSREGVGCLERQHTDPSTSAEQQVQTRSGTLPQSMIPLGWEVPFPEAMTSVPDSATLRMPDDAGGMQAQTFAPMWNILGEDQPPRVHLKLWSYDSDQYLSLIHI